MIEKAFTTGLGADAHFHVVSEITASHPFDAIMARVNSYASQAAYSAGAGVLWTQPVKMPVDIIGGTLPDYVENWLVTSPDSPFSGGQIVADQSATLGAAKDRAWVRIKLARAAAEAGNFIYDGGSYQADKERINGAVTLAMLAKSQGASFSETWTLTDNSTRTLDADQMIAMGIALGEYISGIYATGRALRAQKDAAATIEEVQAVGWPA